MTPFFSVVIPVYNRAAVLGGALRSVRAQTEQDFEIVVVDDGSTDHPERTVESIGDPRIVFIRRDNGGGGAARNTGIDKARGRFVAFLDSDDEFLPHHLSAMRRLLEGRSGVAGYARIVVDRGEGRSFLKPPRAVGEGEDMATYLLCDRGFVPTSTMVVDREQAKAIRFHEDLAAAEDTDFAIRLTLAGVRFLMAEAPGVHWRDVGDPNRLSAGRKSATMLQWIEDLRPKIPAKAYYGCLGWAYAKYAATQDRFGALKLYLNAVLHGCYRPSLAMIVFLQIFLTDRAYRRLADTAVARFGAGFRARR
ncbi:MAG: glycosyltransferase family 2 protein [Alphaproteobacteria bacterium]|nr:glycosyltransferase family 2 protein [Alphaproteobacteria bacterium]MDE2492594.1 glycosyltransferase family 2 protein [Alphaproteobacteria bacterium]